MDRQLFLPLSLGAPSRPSQRPDPSPSEIAEACARFRAAWSDDERRLRAGYVPVGPYVRPTFSARGIREEGS
jgi:hypothetical protein